ncbi:hypothetical protein DDZ18_08730 [Marinicauda salina]|jgi:hypothetical protein|uniref:DUF4168 domain-containing protein n=1 Tax=Marinicauda salina TaxID=2135793 RepID=A0A2U2BUR8_9PROT|nr:DUF4168 domain-containing protein [Marinicauda salina]PWE17729.1 hypothetical protein DDZ18_08730 [Marinicauda salina]
MFKKPLTVFAAAACLTLPAAGAGFAQAGQQSGPPASQAQADFSEDTLRAYVTASVRIQEVAEEYQPLLSSAENQADARSIQEEARAEMAAEVEEAGITVQTYNAVQAAARQNPSLAQEINALAQEVNGG